MADRQSDTLIVLGAGESPVHAEAGHRPKQGEGVYKNTKHVKDKRRIAVETRTDKQQPGMNGRNNKQLLQTSLRGISGAAKRSATRRFSSLYSFFNRYNFETAYHKLNKRAAVGVDRVTYHEYGKNLASNVKDLEERMKAKKYHAKLVRRVNIPKGNGKTRPLGILTLEDKIVQQVAREILEALFEPNFLDCSHGYRPRRSAKQAASLLRRNLYHGWYGRVVEADIRGFFDNIDHEWLVKMVERRVNDSSFIRIIRKWLKAGVLQPDGAVEYPEKGTPQGGIISPILANIYLHYVLDLWFELKVKPACRGEAYLIRYADDFVAAFRYNGDAMRFYRDLNPRFGKFGLKLAEEKTQVLKFTRHSPERSKPFTFLGFEYRWGLTRKGKETVRMSTSKAKFRKLTAAFKAWFKKNVNKRVRWLMPMMRAKLLGVYNYFGAIGNSASMYAFYHAYCGIALHHLNRRSQRKSFIGRTYKRILNHYRVSIYRQSGMGTNQLNLWNT